MLSKRFFLKKIFLIGLLTDESSSHSTNFCLPEYRVKIGVCCIVERKLCQEENSRR